MGFEYHRSRLIVYDAEEPYIPVAIRAIGVPLWFIILTMLILPAWFTIARIRYRRRNRPGHCIVCGYDLRATPDRCPECGSEVRGCESREREQRRIGALTAAIADARAVNAAALAIGLNNMKRPSKTFAILAAISLAMCIALGVEWAMGARVRITPVNWPQKLVTSRRFFAATYAGSIDLVLVSPGTGRPQAQSKFLGFQYQRRPAFARIKLQITQIGIERNTVIPSWFSIVVLLAAPLWFTIATIRYRRRKLAGHCVVCGYDLRATSDRCPECGMRRIGCGEGDDVAWERLKGM